MSDRIVRADDGFQWAWLWPRYWGAWLVGLFLILMALLPWALQKRMGASLGRLAWRLAAQRVADTQLNLSLCFPEYTPNEREALARAVFRDGAIGLFEAANAWFKPLAAQRQRVDVDGLEHVEQAVAQGRGLIILGAHYSTLELNGAIAAQFFPLHIIYRPQNHPVLDWMIRARRRRSYVGQIDHADMRSLFKALKRGEIVWTSVDQDFGLKQGVMAPFFGVPAATLTATSRMARINHSPVLFTQFHRLANDRYRLRFTPVLDDYPSGDDSQDATRMNAVLADLIREAPSQYMWFHRRFKSQPPGEASPYPPKVKKKRRSAP